MRRLFLPESATRQTDWVDQASCRVKPEMSEEEAQEMYSLFFPDRGEHKKAKRAKEICQSCPVRLDCLEYALTIPELSGIWGGLTRVQRSRMRRERQIVA